MNRRIGGAMIGTGWMGATILRRFHEREDVKLVAVHDPNREHALRIIANLQLPLNPESAEEFFSRPGSSNAGI